MESNGLIDWLKLLLPLALTFVIIPVITALKNKADKADLLTLKKDYDEKFSAFALTYKENNAAAVSLITAHKLMIDLCVNQAQLTDKLAPIVARFEDKSMGTNKEIGEIIARNRELTTDMQKLRELIDYMPQRLLAVEAKVEKLMERKDL